MALKSPVHYAGSITSGQKHLGCFGVPGCDRSRCVRCDKKSRTCQLVTRAISVDRSQLDFSNPDWKKQFQEDFNRRFSLPHLKDVIDVEPRPTTFSLKSRAPLENVNGSIQESWNGYVNDDDRALLKVIKFASPTSAGAYCIDPDCSWVEQWVHRAGPRKQIYFEPPYVKAGIVTCGGLCPGLNDVIRQIVLTLEKYGVKNIVGIQHGFRGFFEDHLAEVPLNRHVVQNINLAGGSFLGVSRGGANISDIVDSIQARRLDMLFVLGGNGTHAGANLIHEECRKRKLKVSIVGVPKTIDNDILLMDKTFGFDTAVEAAQRAINSAYIEAHSAFHGIGLVKLMGRSSGFITMHASLSSGQVDICLIPEVPFTLDGPHGVLQHLEHLIETQGFALICVAEGAGQEHLQQSNATDASGNMILSDIGVHLQQKIKSHFKEIGVHSDVKYIDPTYMVRAVRANASDAILCTVLGQNAVHGAFAGFSGITTGVCNTHNVYLPIPEVIKSTRVVDPNSRMWHRCLTSTGQPDFH
ncbi:ATP-dependent 6-phosphofructokinase 5, chloroplastic-like [Oryza brachyantha]|uniref:ATP-dependent 6-phosphofructokinase n=1 Tax=Oryza brachyantha TaxID=4533 RepID=J3N2I3_ORYBR|nr:ATP-dependent 6-phosphofructokinase 5, chloroplastic-like [Oryza brachyantha]